MRLVWEERPRTLPTFFAAFLPVLTPDFVIATITYLVNLVKSPGAKYFDSSLNLAKIKLQVLNKTSLLSIKMS